MQLSNKIIAGKYRLTTLIGQGGFGEVYKAIDTQANVEVVIKLEKKKRGEEPMLIYESKIVNYLHGCTGVPQIYQYGVDGVYYYAAMQHCGYPISSIHNLVNKKFDMKVHE